jgi:hypothetical protein
VPAHAVDLLLLGHHVPHVLAVDHPLVLGPAPLPQLQRGEGIDQFLHSCGEAEEGRGDQLQGGEYLAGGVQSCADGAGHDAVGEGERVVEELLLQVVPRAQARRDGPVDAVVREQPAHQLHRPLHVVELLVDVLQGGRQQHHARVGRGQQERQLDADGSSEAVPAQEYFGLLLPPREDEIDEGSCLFGAVLEGVDEAPDLAAGLAEVGLVVGVDVELVVLGGDLMGEIAEGGAVAVDAVDHHQDGLRAGSVLDAAVVQGMGKVGEFSLDGKGLLVEEWRRNGQLLLLQDLPDVLRPLSLGNAGEPLPPALEGLLLPPPPLALPHRSFLFHIV